MDGRAFLSVARQVRLGATEAHWRTAVGRAYYALLLEAREALARWGFAAPPRDRVHAFVRLRFVYASDQGAKNIGDTLELLGRWRNEADYQTRFSRLFGTPAVAAQAIQHAESALAELDLIDADLPRRASVIAGIRAAFP
jgi:hypothetical protein